MIPIGGYFEIENVLGKKHVTNELLFNSGRSAFAYLLNKHKIKHVWLPIFNCDVILEPLRALNIQYDFYNIDHQLLPELSDVNVGENSAVIINNYFGILDDKLSQWNMGKGFIFDNSQAYYSKVKGDLGSFNSFRKFFGIADGASILDDSIQSNTVAFSEFDASLGSKHLNGRRADGPQLHYQEFLDFEKTFKFEKIKSISDDSRQLYYSLDHDSIKKKRRSNFKLLHQSLKGQNQLKIDLKDSVPMNYPFLINEGSELKKQLIEHEIFITTYWPNEHILPSDLSFEAHLTKNLVSLPIDQRYGEKEMSIILAQIEQYAG